jgi:hypothetical protein
MAKIGRPLGSVNQKPSVEDQFFELFSRYTPEERRGTIMALTVYDKVQTAAERKQPATETEVAQLELLRS